MRQLLGIVFSAILLLMVSAPGARAQKVKVYDLGTYSGGSWAETGGINDLGVMVVQGDASAGGDTHLFTVQLLGPHAPQWRDLGAVDSYQGWWNWPAITDTGLVAGYALTTQGYTHATLFLGNSGRVDLGALADIGYASYNNSDVWGANKLGTMVGGLSWSKPDESDLLPVVWTREIVWKATGPSVIWKIHKLDTLGFPYGFVVGVNNSGQVSGAAYNDAGHYIAMLWNPIPNGNGWKAIQLPSSPDWPDVAIAGGINEVGEIVGDVLSPDWVYGYASLWQPVNRERTTYKLTLLPNPWGLPQGDTAESINDLGDIVGASWDANYNFHAVRWSTKDTTFVKLLGLPGDWSLADSVNNLGIASGTYAGGTCANECVAAAKFR